MRRRTGSVERHHHGGTGTVLVLGGGGGRGAAQVGILRALAEQGVVPDAVVGTSVGALNAAAVAAHPLPEAVAMLEEIWASPQTRAVFKTQLMRVIGNRLRRKPWLRGGDSIRDLVDYAGSITHAHTFDDLRIPLRIILTDLASGEPVVISEGPLRDALRASCAIPGVFPPIRLGERFYVDGGVTENCSISTAAALDPERIIAIDLTADAGTPALLERWSQVLDRVMQVALHQRVRADFDRFSQRFAVTLICPRLLRAQPRFVDFTAVRDNAFRAAQGLFSQIAGDGGLSPGVFYLPITADESVQPG